MNSTIKLLGLPLVGLLCLNGCSLGPRYVRPEASVPAAWPHGPAYHEKTTPPADGATFATPWQDLIADQALRQVIDLALRNNRDLRVAALNIERTQALYQIKRADLLPELDASAGGSGQRIPKDLSATGKAATVEQYTIGLGVTAYELDLFGRLKSLKDQALEQYLASQEAQQTVRISLIAQVAAAYLNLAADRDHLQVAKETLNSQQTSYQLIERRFQLGLSSELDLRQAQTQVDTARVDIARYTTVVAQDENALNLVAGCTVPAELLPQSLADAMTGTREIVPGLSSDILLQRPDVLQAEHLLKGYNANIGAARAAFFPRITLVGSLGTGSDELSGLFGADSLAWTFAPRLTLPIFDNGSNQANLKVAETDREIAVANYQKAIQTAFREVADALAQKGTIDDQIAALQSFADATATSHRLSQARFEQGVDSYLTVLDSQRALYGAQQALIASRLTKLINRVTLYKVLGGGSNQPSPRPD